MADGLKLVDEASTVALLQAFKQAADDQNAAHNSVSGTAANLAGGWKGNASGAYGNGLSTWMNGLQKVHHALQLIDDAMVTFLMAFHAPSLLTRSAPLASWDTVTVALGSAPAMPSRLPVKLWVVPGPLAGTTKLWARSLGSSAWLSVTVGTAPAAGS